MSSEAISIKDSVNHPARLTEKKRERLYDEIIKTAICYHIELISPEIIDEINILNATKLGMKKCVENLEIIPEIAIIDAFKIDTEIPTDSVIKGDAKSYSIACASILAKVARDRYMEEQSKIYPNFGFDKHKGYGTKLHYEMIEKYGTLPIHRKSFLKNLGEHIGRN